MFSNRVGEEPRIKSGYIFKADVEFLLVIKRTNEPLNSQRETILYRPAAANGFVYRPRLGVKNEVDLIESQRFAQLIFVDSTID